VLLYEFKYGVNKYSRSLSNAPVQTLGEVIAFNKKMPRRNALFQAGNPGAGKCKRRLDMMNI